MCPAEEAIISSHQISSRSGLPSACLCFARSGTKQRRASPSSSGSEIAAAAAVNQNTRTVLFGASIWRLFPASPSWSPALPGLVAGRRELLAARLTRQNRESRQRAVGRRAPGVRESDRLDLTRGERDQKSAGAFLGRCFQFLRRSTRQTRSSFPSDEFVAPPPPPTTTSGVKGNQVAQSSRAERSGARTQTNEM